MKFFGSSGIRAVYDKNLLDTAFRVGLAVGKFYCNIIVGRDTRTSGDAMRQAVISGLQTSGANCRDAGVTPTPTLAYITREFDAGIMITASHNPPEYNGLKLLNKDGSSFDLLQQNMIEPQLAANIPVAGSCDIYISFRKGILHSLHLESFHQGLKCTNRIDLCNNHPCTI